MMRGFWAGLALTGMVWATAACGGAPTPAPTGGQPSAQAPAATATSAPTATPQSAGTLTIYSGRNERLIGPLLEQFKKETGADLKVRYGDTAELAAAILEEGDKSPAEVFFAQDAGALGALEQAGRFQKLPEGVLTKVAAPFRSTTGEWVGLSGRARVVVYNTEQMKPEDLPDSMQSFTDPKWKGKLGWAPTNASFQAFVTALRVTEGEAAAKAWLEAILRNEPKKYANNTAIVEAAAKGEILAGFVNHYYLHNLRKQQPGLAADNYHPRAGDMGAMINVAGIGILKTAKNVPTAEKFIAFLLAAEAQKYFAQETAEYPLVPGVPTITGLPTLDTIRAPKLDLASIDDLEGTLKLLQETGVL